MIRPPSAAPYRPTPPSPDHDVIIVGASVAGCRAAITLARRGVHVLLLDRARFPRWKPCAGGLTLKARPYLDPPLFDLVEQTIFEASLTFGEEYITRIRSFNPLGWTVHRQAFDQTHLELAASQPQVQVSTGTRVTSVQETPCGVEIDTDTGPLRAPVLIGADGANSIVSRFLPGHDERHRGFAYEGEARAPAWEPLAHPTEGEGRRVEAVDKTLFDFLTFPRGYGWIFPKEDHFSIGGFVFENRLPDIKYRYREFCEENGWIEDPETFRARGHPTALGGDLRCLASNRILLAGEAGSLVDPLTGEGIYYALRSGHLAGEAAAAFLLQGTPLHLYAAQVRDEIQDELRYARILAKLVYGRPGLAFRLLLRNTLLCRWFVEVGAGTRTYKGLLKELLKNVHRLPFQGGSGREVEVTVEVPQTHTMKVPP